MNSVPVQQRENATIADVLLEVWRLRWWLVGAMLVPALFAFLYAMLASPVYKASVLVRVVSEEQGRPLDSLISQVGGLASLAGMSSLGKGDGRVEPLAVLKSRSLAEDFIKQENLRPVLFPKWWDAESERWVIGDPDGPPAGRTIREFWNDVLRIEEDAATGLVRVEIRWHDPAIAARWANSYIDLANKRLQQRAIAMAESRLLFLNQELAKGGDIQLQQAIYKLMQSEISSAMVANVRRDYAFSILDPAVPPDVDDPWWPRTVPLVVMASIVGLILGLCLAAWIRWARLSALSPSSEAIQHTRRQ
ncbi:MAG: hypothetical protein KDI55_27290 [Anaerolineae bacterium]|nr:hypothetical protein [Anaerolineae bacterium]